MSVTSPNFHSLPTFRISTPPFAHRMPLFTFSARLTHENLPVTLTLNLTQSPPLCHKPHFDQPSPRPFPHRMPLREKKNSVTRVCKCRAQTRFLFPFFLRAVWCLLASCLFRFLMRSACMLVTFCLPPLLSLSLDMLLILHTRLACYSLLTPSIFIALSHAHARASPKQTGCAPLWYVRVYVRV